MKQLINIFTPMLLLFAVIATGCNRNSFSPRKADRQFSECIGEAQHQVIVDLNQQFEAFLLENGFATHEKDLLQGYKKYLQHLLDRKGLDTTWKFNKAALETVLKGFEELHLAEMLYEEKVSQCVIGIEYPDNYLMAHFREVMPQHVVSPEMFATKFIQEVDQEQFEDQVLKTMISLEYFLGPTLYLLRPDEKYFSESLH
jgi:hypothetical protein